MGRPLVADVLRALGRSRVGTAELTGDGDGRYNEDGIGDLTCTGTCAGGLVSQSAGNFLYFANCWQQPSTLSALIDTLRLEGRSP